MGNGIPMNVNGHRVEVTELNAVIQHLNGSPTDWTGTSLRNGAPTKVERNGRMAVNLKAETRSSAGKTGFFNFGFSVVGTRSHSPGEVYSQSILQGNATVTRVGFRVSGVVRDWDTTMNFIEIHPFLQIAGVESNTSVDGV
jgi:hypothetical protein